MNEKITERVRFVTFLESDLQKVVLSGALSRGTTFAVHVTGTYTSKHASLLIQMLSMQCDWLHADEKSADSAQRWSVINDGPDRWVLVDSENDELAPVYDTMEAAQAAMRDLEEAATP